MLFFSGLFMVPMLNTSPTLTSENAVVDDSITSGVMPREIRVAIYDEPNKTAPVYATSPGGIHNNITDLAAILDAAGYTVDLLDVHDIYNYQLKTANYDVFILCDNFPRENITDRVVDFWNGGGGILAFDGSAGFLCYFGILPPDAVGTSGTSTYWSYNGGDIVITERHPVTKSYDGGTIALSSGGYLVWDYPSIAVSSVGADVTRLATSDVDPDHASVLAFEPSSGGGKIVTIAYDLANDVIGELSDMCVDAVDWLTPRPKGRILFDMTHYPYYGIDAGDPVGYTTVGRYAALRDELVSKTFTLDKLYPDDAPSLTSDILEKYDILVIDAPEYAYTPTEISAIHNWVENGGGLLLMGEWNSFEPDNQRLRQILAGYDLNITDTEYTGSPYLSTNITLHPATEAVTTLEFAGGSFVESWGDAYPIVKNNTSGDELVAVQEVGDGRVVLMGDINILGNYIANEDNLQFGYDIANWLVSGGAKILLYTDGKSSLGSDYNFFKSPAALALNELGVNYLMTNEREVFYEIFPAYSWDLVIIDANNLAPANAHDGIKDYINSGGRVIWRDFMFRQSPYDSMWNFMGFAGLDASYTAGPVTIFEWESSHSVFTKPVNYGADNYTSSSNLFATDFTNVTVLSNGTAIAGTTLTYDVNASGIVLSHGSRVLCNMFAISEYLDDTDDSTYADGYELWINEIAFMLRPTVGHPADIEYTEGETGNNIVWVGHSEYPFDYIIYLDDIEVHYTSWNGGSVTYNIDGLTNGTYVFRINLLDNAGYSISDEVTVTVLPYVAPTTTTTGGGGAPLDPTLILIIVGAAGVVIIIIVIIMKKRPS